MLFTVKGTPPFTTLHCTKTQRNSTPCTNMYVVMLGVVQLQDQAVHCESVDVQNCSRMTALCIIPLCNANCKAKLELCVHTPCYSEELRLPLFPHSSEVYTRLVSRVVHVSACRNAG